MFPEDRFLEILIIGALALIVIGPKDLPILMRRIGRFIGKMRGMAAEFRASFDELARQSELDELRREVEALRHTQQAPGALLDSTGEPPVEVEAPAEPAPKPKAVRKPRSKAAKAAGESS